MSRPEHLNCVNTASGISRINEEQAYYDKDPERHEAEERRKEESRREEEENMRQQEREWSQTHY
jgi:FtsZ-interacting cell division protein YlmF